MNLTFDNFGSPSYCRVEFYVYHEMNHIFYFSSFKETHRPDLRFLFANSGLWFDSDKRRRERERKIGREREKER